MSKMAQNQVRIKEPSKYERGQGTVKHTRSPLFSHSPIIAEKIEDVMKKLW